ncbi:hypothetical protein [Pendulispora albinea]|uniref:Uncharacterized protein n=1 Tax=Pendulispora albinea TaxID=2741071 RepID=A0ABZ2M605_9BACT
MVAFGKVSLVGLGAIAGIVSVMGVRLASAQSPTSTAAAATAVLTADTDVAQLRGGYITNSSGMKLVASGPFVLTDLAAARAGTQMRVYVVPGSACPTSNILPTFETEVASHGMRIGVPTGSVACIPGSNSNMSWAGFVPY